MSLEHRVLGVAPQSDFKGFAPHIEHGLRFFTESEHRHLAGFGSQCRGAHPIQAFNEPLYGLASVPIRWSIHVSPLARSVRPYCHLEALQQPIVAAASK